MELFKKVTHSAAVTSFFKAILAFYLANAGIAFSPSVSSYVNMAFFIYFGADGEM